MADVNSGEEHPRGERGSVHTLLESDRTRIVLSGEVDVSVSAELTDAVAEAEAAGVPTQVDAKHVTFIDSSGVALLARLASRTPGRVQILNPPEVLTFLLEVTRIGELVEVVDTSGDDHGGAIPLPRRPDDDPPDAIA
ncbi:STAS domain-containing protein [Pseudactinotalea sp. Z1739]|uniref:STAS domain-containing protein n=1 Tax=Pseudactinotalea sp. Z1739 TaxID=3413028 RepID=UPI003C7B63E0